jgi:hypothetical protein
LQWVHLVPPVFWQDHHVTSLQLHVVPLAVLAEGSVNIDTFIDVWQVGKTGTRAACPNRPSAVVNACERERRAGSESFFARQHQHDTPVFVEVRGHKLPYLGEAQVPRALWVPEVGAVASDDHYVPRVGIVDIHGLVTGLHFLQSGLVRR